MGNDCFQSVNEHNIYFNIWIYKSFTTVMYVYESKNHAGIFYL